MSQPCFFGSKPTFLYPLSHDRDCIWVMSVARLAEAENAVEPVGLLALQCRSGELGGLTTPMSDARDLKGNTGASAGRGQNRFAAGTLSCV